MSIYKEDTVQWNDMVKPEKVDWYDLIRDDRPTEVQYEDVNAEYKDEAKQLLIEEIGFEPEFDEHFMHYEICFRRFVRKFRLGESTKEQLDIWCYRYGFLARQDIWRRGAEHAHLIDPEEFKHGFKM